MNHLKDLNDNYVITPIDEATGNVAFIYKRFILFYRQKS